jgi:hypothetical protein
MSKFQHNPIFSEQGARYPYTDGYRATMKRDEPGQLLFYHWNWRPTAADEKRWTKLFKSLGAANVRSRLNSATSFEPNELIDIGVDPPWPPREFVEQPEVAAMKPSWMPKGADSLSDALWWAMQANDMGLGIAWEIECDDGSRLDRQEIVEMVWRRKRELIANPPKKY